MQEVLDVKETKMVEAKEAKLAFLETISTKEEQLILSQTLKRKEKIAKEGKQSSKGISNITKEMLQSDYVRFDDETSITFEEMLVSKTLADMMMKENKTAKDLGEIQKVVEGNTSDIGVKIVFETNGQDLGD